MPAGVYSMVHHTRVFLNENPVITRPGQPVVRQRANDLASIAAGAERVFRRLLNDAAS